MTSDEIGIVALVTRHLLLVTVSMHDPTSIDEEHLTCDVVTVVRSKKDASSEEVLGLLQPAQRSPAHIIFRDIGY